eukprot:scaffold102_cov133-Isochrysis_galbana.AAC.8
MGERDHELLDGALVYRNLPHRRRGRVRRGQPLELGRRRQLARPRLHLADGHVALLLDNGLLSQQAVAPVGRHGQQVEPDLAGRVLLDAGLDGGRDSTEPGVALARLAQADRPRLEPVQLVQLAVDRHI